MLEKTFYLIEVHKENFLIETIYWENIFEWAYHIEKVLEVKKWRALISEDTKIWKIIDKKSF